MNRECPHAASASGPFGEAKVQCPGLYPSINTWNYCMCHQGHILPGAQNYRKCVGDGKYRKTRWDILAEFNKAGKGRRAMLLRSDTMIAFQEK